MTSVRAGLAALLALPLLTAAKAPAPPAPPHPVHATAKPMPKPKTAPAPPSAAEKPDALPSRSFPHGVIMTEVTYRQISGYRPLTLDLYRTNEKSPARPVLIFLHGGGWKEGDSRHADGFADLPSFLATLAGRGFVVASVEYRLSGEARFPAALQDVKSAIRWLRAHKTDANLDDTRLAVWGVEAGGQLAAMAGVSCGVTPLEPEAQSADQMPPPSDCVQAVIDWRGPSDFENQSADLGKPAPDQTPAGAYLGCEPALCPVGVAKNASPLAYIEAMSPSFLIQQGQDDPVVSPKQSQRLYDALKAKGVPAELVLYPGLGADLMASDEPLKKLEMFLDATFPRKAVAAPRPPAPRKGLSH